MRRLRAAHESENQAHVVRQPGALVAEQPDHVGGLRVVVEDEATRDDWPDRIEPVLERRDDAEVAAAAADSPEEVRVLALACRQDVAGGRDDARGDQVVRCGAELPHQPTEPPAQREAGNACRRDRSSGDRQPMLLRRSVELPPVETRLGADECGRPRRRRSPFIDERLIIKPPSQTARPATLWPPPRTESSKPSIRALSTAATTSAFGLAATDQGRSLVDHPVVDPPRLLVAFVALLKDEQGPRVLNWM